LQDAEKEFRKQRGMPGESAKHGGMLSKKSGDGKSSNFQYAPINKKGGFAKQNRRKIKLAAYEAF